MKVGRKWQKPIEKIAVPVCACVCVCVCVFPVNDGGQYDMFVNIIEKYGIVPKR